jgi:hypothetical protein
MSEKVGRRGFLGTLASAVIMARIAPAKLIDKGKPATSAIDWVGHRDRNSWTAVIYDSKTGVFVAAAADKVMSSADGITWTTIDQEDKWKKLAM